MAATTDCEEKIKQLFSACEAVQVRERQVLAELKSEIRAHFESLKPLDEFGYENMTPLERLNRVRQLRIEKGEIDREIKLIKPSCHFKESCLKDAKHVCQVCSNVICSRHSQQTRAQDMNCLNCYED